MKKWHTIPKMGDKKSKKKNGVSLLNPALLIGFIVSRVSFISLVLVCCLKKVLEFIFKTPTLFLKIHRILVSYTNNNLIVKV